MLVFIRVSKQPKKKKNGCLISPIFVMVCWLSGSCGASDLVSTFTFYPRLWALVR